MRTAGRIVALVLDEVRRRAAPGVATAELDRVAEEIIRSHHAVPSFKGYGAGRGRKGFPASICSSIDQELVHGIPSRDRILREGQILSIDVGACYEGYHGDAAITLPVGEVSPQVLELIKVTEGALYAGIAAARAGNRIGDISSAIQEHVESHGFAVVREYTGHGIGRQMHEGLLIPNYGEAGQGLALRAGMTMALEPMVHVGDWRTRVLDDEWTVVTWDGTLSAHAEHTILVQEEEAEILTRL